MFLKFKLYFFNISQKLFSAVHRMSSTRALN